MSMAYEYCSSDIGEGARQMSIEGLQEIDELRKRSSIAGTGFINQILEIAAIRSEALALSVNTAIVVGNPVFTSVLDDMRLLTRRIEDDILNSAIIENVPMTIVKRLRNANMNLVDAICQLDLATNPAINKIFEGRKPYA